MKVSALGRTSLLERMTVIITHIRDLFRKFSQARAALPALGPGAGDASAKRCVPPM